MNIREAIVGTVITVVIGGTAYSINQADVVNNFADDAGLTTEQAERYIDDIGEDDLATFEEIGISYIEEGGIILEMTADIDCVNYEYDWESASLSCDEAVEQLNTIGSDSILLGEAYVTLDSDTPSDESLTTAIELIDIVNDDYDFAIVSIILDPADIDDSKKTGSYNKAILEAVLDSE